MTRRRVGRDEAGFTLVELLVVVAIMPLIVGAISVALLSVISQQNTVSSKVSDSGDATVVSSNFVQDVQSAGRHNHRSVGLESLTVRYGVTHRQLRVAVHEHGGVVRRCSAGFEVPALPVLLPGHDRVQFRRRPQRAERVDSDHLWDVVHAVRMQSKRIDGRRCRLGADRWYFGRLAIDQRSGGDERGNRDVQLCADRCSAGRPTGRVEAGRPEVTLRS